MGGFFFSLLLAHLENTFFLLSLLSDWREPIDVAVDLNYDRKKASIKNYVDDVLDQSCLSLFAYKLNSRRHTHTRGMSEREMRKKAAPHLEGCWKIQKKSHANCMLEKDRRLEIFCFVSVFFCFCCT